jgi:hypothetical protein
MKLVKTGPMRALISHDSSLENFKNLLEAIEAIEGKFKFV